MKKTSAITTIIASLFLMTPAMAADWQYVTDAGKSAYNMDFDSIGMVNGYRKAWVKVNHFGDKKTIGYPSRTYKSQIMLYYFDCKGKMLSVTQSNYYSELNGAGEVVSGESGKFNANNLDEVVPGSVGEGLMKVACDTSAARDRIRAKNDAFAREYLKGLEDDPNKQDRNKNDGI